ncbi:GntR family transcriptional regulator [Amycolatopsis rhabdoformis]|uniref:GntR family transcriptional regulator n=1 Tax=Amycolatopsis rhabdoformis TaxID=1448059 RepID=A0ABZ1IHL6_9PSEU|nr:GntR family transcriptional regulator [Amycolatopsis rhabdoformis]WSE33606.1 GntR family transcriptional regulator [Amycolatopsis rhabdoformis]
MSEPTVRWDSMRIDENAPKRAPSLADQAYATLKGWVVSGELEPGAVLSENDLARRFSISRSPLREAIRRLQDEGLLDISGPRGFTVPALSVEFVRQVYTVRRALEVAAAQTATGIPPEDLAAMHVRMDRIGEAIGKGDLAPFNVADFEFHDLFVLNCGNPLLVNHIHRLRGHIQRTINWAGQFHEHTELAYKEHLAILEAMEAGDPHATGEAVDTHIRNVMDRLVDKLDPARKEVSID